MAQLITIEECVDECKALHMGIYGPAAFAELAMELSDLRGAQKQFGEYLVTDRVLYPKAEGETVSTLRQEIVNLRTALDKIGDAAEVYIISGEEGCRPSLGWIEKTAHEALERQLCPQQRRGLDVTGEGAD